MSEQRSTTPNESPPPADGAPRPDAAPSADASSGPVDPNASQEGPSRRAFTFSMPLRPPGAPEGQNAENGGGPGDFITWTFEVFPGPPPGALEGDGQPHPATQTSSDQPGNSDSNTPRIGPFGLAGARPPDRTNPIPNPNPGMPFPPGMELIFGSLDHREILSGLMPLFASGLTHDRRPDPAKAAELIRALPTVDKAMMDRVDRVVIAADDDDEETGWKCSICLEGAEVTPAEGSAAIKATPCHHLFHSGCLEPWFQTKTSCPMCRESLDSLRTQADNEQRSSVRPPPSRTTTPSTHPYARPSATRSPPRASPLTVTETASTTATSDQEAPVDGPEANTRDIRGTHTNGSMATSTLDDSAPAETVSTSAEPTANAAGVPETSAVDSAAGATVTEPAETTQTDPTSRRLPVIPVPSGPQAMFRMPFMAVINIGPNGPEPARQITPPVPVAAPLTDGPIHTSPMPMDRLSSPVPGPLPGRSVVPRLPGSGMEAHTNPPRPQQANAANQQDHASGDAPAAAPASDTPQITGNGLPTGPTGMRLPMPPFTFFSRLPPPPSSPEAQTQQPPRPSAPRPSLASYILSKERDLGLTCAAATCKYAHELDSIQEDKEDLLSIRAIPSVESSMPKFACAHKWHRDCLADSSAFTPEDSDVEGKIWTACGMCGAKGWVTFRDDARSEGEVERLVHA